MLPFKRHDGISSTYGIDLMGSFVIPEDPQDSISFDRVRNYTDTPRHLEPIKSTFKVHDTGLRPAIRDIRYRQTADHDLKHSAEVGANRVSYNWSKQDVKLSSSIDTVDPTRSKMNLMLKNNQGHIIAAKTDNGCILSFAVIPNSWIGWDLISKRETEFQDRLDNDKTFGVEQTSEEEFEEPDMSKDPELALTLPDLNFKDTIDFKDEIIGLEFVNTKNDQLSVIAVRTKSAIAIISIKLKSSGRISIKKLSQLKSDDYWSQFAHVNLHSTKDDGILMVVIDINANFKVYKMVDDTIQHIVLKYDSFYEPTELSVFKSSFWLSDNRLILYSRTQIHELNLETQKLKCRVTGGIFSRFLDIQSVLGKVNWMILLTTKEVIVVDGTKGFKKRLAWKHFLNHEDKSFYLQVFRAPYQYTNIICRISSKTTNFNQLIQIDPHDLKIIDYPQWFFTHKKVIESSCLFSLSTLSSLFLLVQSTPLNEVSTCILKFTSFYHNLEKYGRPCRKKVVTPEYIKYGQLKNEMFFHHITGDLKSTIELLTNKIIVIEEEKREDSDLTLNKNAQQEVQAYADKLSEALSHFVDGLKCVDSFQQLIEYTSNQLSINELMDMMTEFIDHFQTSNIFDFYINSDLWKTETAMKYNAPITDVDALRNSYKVFLPLLKNNKHRSELAKYVGFHLILSSITIHKREMDTDKYDEYLAKNCELLSEEDNAMLKEFEDDMNAPGQYIQNVEEDDKTDKKKLNIDMPTVTVSQSQKRTRSTPVASQIYSTNSSQSMPASNISPKRPQKKLKKRRTGF